MSTRETPTHSPAPWTLDESRIHGRVRDANGKAVATVDGNFVDERIILKAPDLLAVVRALVLSAERKKVSIGTSTLDVMRALVDHIDGGGE